MTKNFEELATAHRNVVGFIDPYLANWFTGTGSTAKPHHDGNQDIYVGSDGIHPNGAGQQFYQARIVKALSNLPIKPRQPRDD